MHYKSSVVWLAGVLLTTATVAAPIPGLFPTGVDGAGLLLPAGAVDPHYRLVQSADPAQPGPDTYVIPEGFPIPPWAANGPNSKWISPQLNQSPGNAAGDYRYALSFDLAGLDPATARIDGLWSSDNTGTSVVLNGVPAGFSNDGDFSSFTSTFTLTSGFVDGINTLEFVVNNAGSGPSPTGLRVELNGTAEFALPPGTPPSILSAPTNQAVNYYERATLSVRASGAAPLSYQWRKNQVLIPGATASTFSIYPFSQANAGSYDVIVTNAWGAVTSAPPAVLSVKYPSPAELTYEAPGPSSRRTGLAITEIMYHPAPRSDGRNLEFIEIYNSNPFSEDIGGYRLSGEWDYSFAPGTSIPGLGYLVVAANPSDLQTVYGLTGVLGGFTNNLANSSGVLRLSKPSGGIVLQVEYRDQPPWPVAADGAGHSLVLARPSYGENHPNAWAASATIGGSPSGPDPIPTGPLENIVINEFLAHTDPPDVDYIELYNHSAVPVDLSGCILTDDPDTNKFVIPESTTIPAQGFVSFTEASLGFALSAAGETLYLKNPARTRVIDAVRFEAQQNGVATGRFPDGDPQFYPLSSQTRGTNNAPIRVSQVVINELMYKPLGDNDDDQYVELWNRGTQPVNLGGWRLEDGISFTFPSNTVVPANGYLVVARNLTRLLDRYPNLNGNNAIGNFSGRLAHNGERLTLTMPDLLVSVNNQGLYETNTIHIAVDEVTFGTGGTWGYWADGGGSSLELVDARSNHRLPSNWADSDETTKSQWTDIEITGVLDHGHPSVPTAEQLQVLLLGEGEALLDNVEVFLSGGPNRLTNSTFETGGGGWFPQGTHRLSAWTNAGYNSSGSLCLRASGRGNQVVDRVRAPFTTAFNPGQVATIRAKARWLRGWPELLLRFKGGYLETVGRLPVPTNLGTPGAPNSQARPNAGPAITAVTHSPALPPAGQAVRVTAKVHDPDGVSGVQLKYRIDPVGSLVTVSMADDGLNADHVAGDGIYSGLIPAQPANTLVAFRVEASDQFTPAGNSQFPREAPVRECLVRFGENLPPGAFGSYRFWITQANFSFWSGREKLSSENIDATFIYGTNRVIYNIGARYGGSPYSAPGYTTPTGTLCGYSLDFLRDNWLLGDTRFVLDYLTRDPTGQREQLMFWFLEQFGLPNNYRRYIRLAVNGVLRGSVYEDVQRPGNDMIEQWFPNDTEGSLFKTDIWDEFNDAGGRIGSAVLLNSLENFTTTGGVRKVARYRWGWEPRAVRQSANDFTDLFALVDAANAPASGYQSAIEGLVDVEHWMKTFCMNDLASYWDGFGNPNCKNTYVYKPQYNTWKLMSWDFDVGLGVFNDPVDAPLFPDLADSAMMRLYSFPAFVRYYWGAMDEALNTFFRVGSGTPIETLLDKKYAAFQTNGLALESPAAIKNWISQRRAFLAGQLAAVATSFSVSGPSALTTNHNAIVLAGTAPVNVRTITVNGVPWAVTWLSLTSWRLVLPVANGTTNLTVQALNRLQQPITGAARTITVTCTAPDEQPENAIVFNELMPLPRAPGAEYVELFNRSTNYSFDLSGWQVNGLAYTFPPGTVITNQQHLVLAKDRAAFGAGYGWGIHVAGLYDGVLQADGETLTLLRPGTNPAAPSEIAKVRYETTLPWPLGAEGTGSSYQLIDPAQDHWRAGNWSLIPTNTQPQIQPQWVYFSTNGTASSSILYLYLESVGDIYLDDLKLVAGTVPDAGANLIANGGFETALASWSVTGNFSQSAPSMLAKRSGNASLHLVATAPGTGNGNSIYQTISPSLTPNAPYALSFWYLQTTNGGPLTVRLSASGVTSGSINTAPPANPVLPTATPGTANSVQAVLPAFPPLWINELQAENLTGITNRAGQPVPWIELFNPTSNTVSLAGCFLANSYTNLFQWPFPANAILAPGEFKIIFADNQTQLTTATEWHANFNLTPGSGQLALSRLHNSEPQVLDFTAYRALPANRSWGSLPDAQCYQRQAFFYPTPAQTNNGAAAPLALFINEWMADNTSSLADPADDDYEDWFEIYNPGAQPVDLGGCFLTDTLANKFQSQVPANGQYIIPPRGFLLVWADSESSQNSTNVPDLHVSFKLDKAGEGIYLFASDGTAVDAITFGNQTTDVTQGRFPDGADAVFITATPTPRQANVLANTPPVLTGIPLQFVHAGQTLQLTVLATDAQSAVQQLAFSLEPGFPADASIHPATGLFSWPVPAQPAPSTNAITVRVTDNGLPPLSDVTSFTAVVLPRPQLAVAPAGSRLQLSFTGLSGRTYQVQYKNELSDASWLPLSSALTGTGQVLLIEDDLATHPRRFYRIALQ